MRGSLTVEAAFVFPFCFLIILILCQLGIFQYDRAVLKITAYECILKTVEDETLTEGELAEQLKSRALRTGTERVIGTEELTAAVKVTASKISITFQGTHRILKTPMEASAVYERVYPELTLRIARGVGRE